MLTKKFNFQYIVAATLIACAGCVLLVPGQIFSSKSLSEELKSGARFSLQSDPFPAAFNREFALTTETVPDRVAQSVFLLIISNFLENGNDRLARKYIQTMGQADCAACTVGVSDQGVNYILQAARNYRNALTIFDVQAIGFRSAK